MNRRLLMGLAILVQLLVASATRAESNAPNARQPIPLPPPLVGSWVVRVVSPTLPPFTAIHTFHLGGTFTETTDLLTTLSEGPAHGAWSGGPEEYLATFQLFVFDEHRAPAGRIRVRCKIKVVDEDNFTGDSVADYIDPDGNLILAVDRAPLFGKRIRLEPFN